MDKIPVELVRYTLSFLTQAEVLRGPQLVCKLWHTLANSLCREKAHGHWLETAPPTQKNALSSRLEELPPPQVTRLLYLAEWEEQAQWDEDGPLDHDYNLGIGMFTVSEFPGELVKVKGYEHHPGYFWRKADEVGNSISPQELWKAAPWRPVCERFIKHTKNNMVGRHAPPLFCSYIFLFQIDVWGDRGRSKPLATFDYCHDCWVRDLL